MQTLLLPTCRSGLNAPPPINAVASPHHSHLHRLSRCPSSPLSSSFPSSCLTSPNQSNTRNSSLSSSLISPRGFLDRRKSVPSIVVAMASSSPVSPADDLDKAKLAQVSKRLESTSRYFKRLGSLGFWGQLVSTLVAAVILSFSAVVTGKVSSPATFYATAGGIVAAFISVFWSFGYIQLAERLRRNANDPSKAPPRADVVKNLRNGIVVNLLGMGATVLGMQATVGLLVAKALTSSANPYQGISPGYSPVIALDVFLVQASANTILSHFLGLLFSLELLRSVAVVPIESIPVSSSMRSYLLH